MDYQNPAPPPLEAPVISQPQPTAPYSQPPSPSLTINEPGFTQKEVTPFTWKAWLKLGIIIFFLGGIITAGFVLGKTVIAQEAAGLKGDVLLAVPYQPVLWKDFGEVFEPIIKLPLYYPSSGYANKEFLLDSGALVSSLPREEAKKMGLSLAKLPRSTFGGFGGTTSFAYKSEVKVKLGEKETMLPAVFTEAAGTKPIIGRSGFFEKYSIHFNADKEVIEIRE